MMLFVFVRTGSWTVSCFMATLSIEGVEKDAIKTDLQPLKLKLSKSVRATLTISNAGIFKIFAVSCHKPLWKLHFLEALTRAELHERICFCQL